MQGGVGDPQRSAVFDLLLSTMDLDNFQSFDSASHYGGAHSIAEDTASVISGYTTTTSAHRRPLTDDLESLSLNDEVLTPFTHTSRPHRARGEDDFEGVLDEFKEDSLVNLPPHACRSVRALAYRILFC